MNDLDFTMLLTFEKHIFSLFWDLFELLMIWWNLKHNFQRMVKFFRIYDRVNLGTLEDFHPFYYLLLYCRR